MRKEGRFKTLGKTALDVVRSLMNVQDSDPYRKESIQNLLKLLYYTNLQDDQEPTKQADVDLTFVRENIYENRITQVPVIPEPENEKCMLVITFDDFLISDNEEMIMNAMAVDILVPVNAWLVGESFGKVPRAFLIAEEVKNLLNKQRFYGNGALKLVGMQTLAITATLLGYRMVFSMGDLAGDLNGVKG